MLNHRRKPVEMETDMRHKYHCVWQMFQESAFWSSNSVVLGTEGKKWNDVDVFFSIFQRNMTCSLLKKQTQNNKKAHTVDLIEVTLHVDPVARGTVSLVTAPVGFLDGEVPLARHSVLACNHTSHSLIYMIQNSAKYCQSSILRPHNVRLPSFSDPAFSDDLLIASVILPSFQNSLLQSWFFPIFEWPKRGFHWFFIPYL